MPIGTNQILKYEAKYYGFIKNGNPNISGFLNSLIPALSDYQEDLYEELLKYNNGDAETAKKVEPDKKAETVKKAEPAKKAPAKKAEEAKKTTKTKK